jgi:hypothetical protein
MTCLTSTPLQLAALHMGALHAHERLLVLLIAFGPFVVLAAVVFVLRRRDVAAEAREAGGTGAPGKSGRSSKASKSGEAGETRNQGRPEPAYDRPEGS